MITRATEPLLDSPFLFIPFWDKMSKLFFVCSTKGNNEKEVQFIFSFTVFFFCRTTLSFFGPVPGTR